jgi:hypothetical protein
MMQFGLADRVAIVAGQTPAVDGGPSMGGMPDA